MAIFKGDETPYAQARAKDVANLILSDAEINPGIEEYIQLAARQSALLHAIACIVRVEDTYSSTIVQIVTKMTEGL